MGVNGAGKSSVLQLVGGSLEPDRGRVKHGKTIALAHLFQQVPAEDPDARVLPSIEDIRRVTRTATGQEVSASSMLERFGFTGDKLTARIGDLSGGERRRFQLLKLLLAEPNVLLLDEPTNDLDIDTLNVLEDFLDGWPGTLVVVSHDRYFLERVTDSVWALMGDGQISMLPNGVDQYLEREEEGTLPRAAGDGRAKRRVEGGGADRAERSGGAKRGRSVCPVGTTTGDASRQQRNIRGRATQGQGGRRRRACRPQDRGPPRQAARTAQRAGGRDRQRDGHARVGRREAQGAAPTRRARSRPAKADYELEWLDAVALLE